MVSNGKNPLVVGSDPAGIERAAAAVRQGGVVAYPTESSYGLGVLATSAEPLRRLASAKRRPPDQAFPVLVSGRAQAEELVGPLAGAAARLAEEHWPGGLTLIARPLVELPPEVASPLGVGLRASSHPIASSLVGAVGAPITSTSANTSGQKPGMTAEEVCEIFGDRVDIVIDGKAGGNLASTVAAVWGWGVEILRQGPIEIPQDERVTRDQILRGRLTLLQPARGYRFSIDALLLADFAATIVSTSLSSISSRSEQVRGADLGSGCGVVALALWSLLARPGLDLKPSPDTRPHQATPDLQPPPAQPGREATPDLQPPPAQPGREATPDLQPRLEMGRPCPAYLETFEIQPKLAELARLNVGLNSADASVEVVERDVREISRRQASHQLHFAVSNPPFRPAGKGRASPDVQKETALCDRSLSPEELARAFANVLVPGGWAIAIYPAGRLSEVFSAFRHAGLRIERVRAAHPTADRPARRVLVAATRSKTKKALTVEPPLIMHTEEGTDTDELRRIVGEEPSAQNPIRP